MKKLILLISLSLTLNMSVAEAGCLDGFKAAIGRYIERRRQSQIQTIIAKQLIQRISPFKKKIKSITWKSFYPLNFKSSERFITFSKLENLEGKLRTYQEMSKVIWRTLNEGSDIVIWVKGLQRELYTDAYLNAPFKERMLLKFDGLISKTTLLRFFRKKYLETNIVNGFVEIERAITDENFGFILQSNNLIIDRAFKNKSHGEFIHMLQVDMMFEVLGRHGFTKSEITEFYRWMGDNFNTSIPGTNIQINPLKDVWTTLFDSFESNLGKPELLNPMLLKALGLR